MSTYEGRIWLQELCLDIGELPVTAQAVRHAITWFENSQPNLGIFNALGNVTTTATNLVASDEKYF